MAIYLNTKKVSDLRAFAENPENKTYQVIGTVYASAIELLKQPNPNEKLLNEHLRLLGVKSSDKEAVRSMTQFLRDVDDNLRIVPSENTGVYFIQKNQQNIAVFKIGHKRAVMETLVRRFAYYLGLEKHVVPGMLCAIQNPPFQFDKNPKETIEELWSGNEKIFLDPANPHSKEKSRESSASAVSFETDEEPIFEPDPETQTKISSSDSEDAGTRSAKSEDSLPSSEKTACAVVGIVQPYLSSQETPSSLFEYTLMTILALAIGLRDGKKDGYTGSTLFDVEDCMPRRIDPVVNKDKIEQTVSALDLPFLDKDIRTLELLSESEISHLAEIVKKWNISTIIHKLHKEKIMAFDQTAEHLPMKNDGFDDGKCLVSVETPVSPHMINGIFNHLHDNPKKRALTNEQLDACDTRLHRIRDFIIGCKMKKQPLSPQALYFAVDPYGKVVIELIRRSPSLPSELDQLLSSGLLHGLLGRKPSPVVITGELIQICTPPRSPLSSSLSTLPSPSIKALDPIVPFVTDNSP